MCQGRTLFSAGSVTKGEHGSCGLFYRHITIKMMISSDNCKGRLYYKHLTLALALPRVINYAPRATLQIVTSLMIIAYYYCDNEVDSLNDIKMSSLSIVSEASA
jgi:hypothetical protein